MGHLERGRNLKLLQAARESIFPIYLAFFCISDRSKKIRGTRGAQPIARVSRPRSSPRSPRAASRASPHAAWIVGLHSAQDAVLTRNSSRKRPCNARSSARSAAVHRAMARSAHIWRTDAPQTTMSTSSAIVPMGPVAASMTASTLQVAVGDKVGRSAAGGVVRGQMFQGRPGVVC